MNTTFKKKAGVVLFIIFAIFCGLQFVFNNSLTANAEIALTASADGSVKTSVNSLTLHPYSYIQDFEGEDPFSLWTSNGTYTVNYKGITNERSSSGKKSFKIDIKFGTATYVYFKIPIRVPSIGKLDFSGNLFVKKANNASASLGTNISFKPCPQSGVNKLPKQDVKSTQWVRQSSDLVDTGKKAAERVLKQYYAEVSAEDVGIWTDMIGLLLYGKDGSEISVYVDDLSILGTVPTITDYENSVNTAWNTYLNSMQSKIEILFSKIGQTNDEKYQTLYNEIMKRGYPTVDEYNQLVKEAVNKEIISNTDIATYIVNPISKQKILPNTSVDSLPFVGEVNEKSIKLKACRNEFEPASFVIRTNIEMKNISIDLTNFTGSSGSTISKDAVDVRLVKCWYQAGDGSVAKGVTTLTPELLLKDNSLVKVDEGTRTNYLKVRMNGNDSYIDISSINAVFPDKAEIYDADTLQPFDMPKNTNIQVWLTFHLPDNAAFGEYLGTISINSAGKLYQTLKVVLTVLPFTLQESVIDYSLYYRGHLRNGAVVAINSEDKSANQYEIELQNMKNHGVLYPVLYQHFDEMLSQALLIRKNLGLPVDKLYALRIGTQNMDSVDATALIKLKSDIVKWKDFIHNNGYDNLYIYGKDEATGEALLNQRTAWQAAHEAGVKVFVAGSQGAVDMVGDLLDLSVLAGSFKPDEVKKWHAMGKKVFIYANPQVGVEDAEVYRNNYGIALLCNGYNGVMNYAYQHGFGQHIWNDFDYEQGRDHVFAYPTSNGVIDTIQWEGFREAIDDVRYLTTLANIKNVSENEFACNLMQTNSNLSSIRDTIINQILQANQ
ncbi:MAG: hypothetical protein AB7U45_04995 [Desulfamplus sp.]